MAAVVTDNSGVTRGLCLSLLAVAFVAALPCSAAPAQEAADPFALTEARAHVAEVIRPTSVRSEPGGGAFVGQQDTVATWGRGPVRLLVLQSALAPDGSRWLQVRLGKRPNDASGWIDRESARMSSTAWRLVLTLRTRRLEVLRAGKRKWQTRVVIGAPETPTPTGLFAILEEIRQPKGENIGPWALHLTAHSDVLESFGGGPGRVAIHGRSGSLLRDPLGSARSHGCIRMSNAAVNRLAQKLQAGTPVEIR